MANNSVLLEIITPRELYYSGEVEMLIVKTLEGDEGFMAGHTWCCKLLADEGIVKFRETGTAGLKTVKTDGGFVDINDHFVVYTEDAVSGDGQEAKN